MTSDPITEFKAKQREGWGKFAPIEVHTTKPAAVLVRFAGVKAGQQVLDVGCGTGVAALTARRVGAKVTGLDLSPELLAHAKENAGIAGFDDVTWKEGDAESLPFGDAAFDVVLSQWGHMFAPRPEVATKEMLRVLRPGGTIAFATWPPESSLGQMFRLVGKYLPPPPGVSPPPQWGEVATVQQRLGTAVKDVVFQRSIVEFPALSPQHARWEMERTSAPVIKLLEGFRAEPAKAEKFRAELDAVFATYFQDNCVRHEALLTRGVKA